MKQLKFSVSENEAGQRLDLFLSLKIPDLTRSALQKLIEKGDVSVNGSTSQKNARLKNNDDIHIDLSDYDDKKEIKAQNIDLSIIYEDDDLLIVNKPKGMVVHPAAGNHENTLVNALLYKYGTALSDINGLLRPGIVHRLDKDSSGLLIVAKNNFAHESLAEQIKSHSMRREYLAVVLGNPKEISGAIDLPLGRNPKDRKKQAIDGINPRQAKTFYDCISFYKGFCLVKCRLETGRTHQIRVHMAHLGHPVAGDLIYGGKKNDFSLNGQCLHAFRLGFKHPKNGKELCFTAPLPDYFTLFLDKIEKL